MNAPITQDNEYPQIQQNAIALYETLDGVSNLDRRAEICYEACHNLYDEFTIARIAKAENEYLRTRFSIATLGTKLSKHGYYKRFRSILLKDGLNAYQEEKQDGAKVLKHLFFKYCGLSAQEWSERNESDRVVSRLSNAQSINPGEVIKKIMDLIGSDNHWEIAAALIAATGRRPHEIVARAKFAVDGDYHLTFEGQGKKRGEKPVFRIASLIPSEIAVSALARFRKSLDVQALLKEVRAANPRDLVKQNDEIDRRTNGSINRIVRREFAPVVPARHGEKEDNCKALRAAYSAISTRRDVANGSIGEQMLYASRLLGHFVSEEPSDRELAHIVTTIGYSDYRVNGEVPYPPMPERIPYKDLPKVRVSPEAKTQLDEWGERWGCSIHEVVDRLVEAMAEKLARPATEIQQEEPEMSQATDTRFDAMQSQIDRLTQLVESLASGQVSRQSDENANVEPTVSAPKPASTKRQPTRDWSEVSKDELFGLGGFQKPARGNGASDERIARAVGAIVTHNDQFPAEEMAGKKWSLDAFAVRQLSGCNGQIVARWFDVHHGMVADHNQKHGLTGQFHNRENHQGEDIYELLFPLIP